VHDIVIFCSRLSKQSTTSEIDDNGNDEDDRRFEPYLFATAYYYYGDGDGDRIEKFFSAA
jgi:hypothetical protein